MLASWYARRPLWPLIPLAALFAALAAARRWLYATGVRAAGRLPVPVVVVGNLVAGGAGKTPVVLALARALAEAGWRPGILSRGYGGRWRAPALVTPDTTAAECGDEALLLARALQRPVAVARRRIEAGRLLLARHPECDVLVCDDGLQHYALARDVELVVVDGTRGFGNGWLLPAGPLREPVSRLAHVQALLLHAGSSDEAALEVLPPGLPPGLPDTVPRWRLRMIMGAPQRCTDGMIRDWPAWVGAPVHAVAGIAHPGRFFAGLRAHGLQVAEHPFPDHHAYRPDDFALPGHDPVLLTAKDAVKLPPSDSTRYWVVPWTARLPAGFLPWLLELLEDARGRKDP